MKICVICLNQFAYGYYNYKFKCTSCNSVLCNDCYTVDVSKKWINNVFINTFKYDLECKKWSCSIECFRKCSDINGIIRDNRTILFKRQYELINEYRSNSIMSMLNFHFIKDLSKIIIEYEC